MSKNTKLVYNILPLYPLKKKTAKNPPKKTSHPLSFNDSMHCFFSLASMK